MTIDHLALDRAFDRAADAAAPDPPTGSGAAAAPRVARAVEADHLPVPWGGSRRWADARVVPMDPAAVATAWLAALARGDWTTVWSTSDANLRLAVAQQWLARLGRTGDNVSAWSLAAEVPHVGMWAPFADQLFARWTRELDRTPLRSGDDLRVSGPSVHHQLGRVGRVGRLERPGRSERSDVGRELCVVVGRDGDGRSTGALTLRLRDRWRIAGLGRGVLQPGWPARWLELEACVDAP
jgi:hypothetical protein